MLTLTPRRALTPARVTCPVCQLTGPDLSCRLDAQASAEIHDGLHHAGKPTAKAQAA